MYQVDPTDWSDTELLMLLQAVGQIMSGLEQQSGSAAGAKTLLANLMGNKSVSIRRAHIDGEAGWGWSQEHRTIYAFSTSTASKMAWTLAHETGHVVEGTFASAEEFLQLTGGTYYRLSGDALAHQMRLRNMTEDDILQMMYTPGSLGPLARGHGTWSFNAARHPFEDWAETFAYGTLCGGASPHNCGAAHSRPPRPNVYDKPGQTRLDYYQLVVDRAR